MRRKEKLLVHKRFTVAFIITCFALFINSSPYLYNRSSTMIACNALLVVRRTLQHPRRSTNRWFSSATSTSSGFTKIHHNPLNIQTKLIASPHYNKVYRSSSSLLSSSASASSWSKSKEDEEYSNSNFYSKDFPTFRHLGIRSEVLLQRLSSLGYTRPSTIQATVFAHYNNIVTNAQQPHHTTDPSKGSNSRNFIVGAETGSGKTLAYLLPLIDDILVRKQLQAAKPTVVSSKAYSSYDYARAVILVPNKELAQQILRMASGLCADHPSKSIVWGGGTNFYPKPTNENSSTTTTSLNDDPNQGDEDTVVRVAILPGNLDSPMDFKPFRDTIYNRSPPVDLLICTPAALGPWGLSPKHVPFFMDVQTLVVDEADMLLDGGFKRDLDNIFQGFRRADRLEVTAWEEEEEDQQQQRQAALKTQHIFVGATIPNYGLKSVDAYIGKKFPSIKRIMIQGMHHARHTGLRYETLWLEDSMASKDENRNKLRMEQLVKMLKGIHETIDLREEKVMIFLNSIEDVDGATNALRRAGITAIPYHAKIPLAERTDNLDRFRTYVAKKNNSTSTLGGCSAPVLVSTDLASRGLDIPGVTAIVQLQFAGNVVSHLHRMGRCGRAGERNGRGIIFYSPREKTLVDVVREAEKQQQEQQMILHGDVHDEDEKERSTSSAANGTVIKAFSRRRGFTKKIKKNRRQEQQHKSSS